MKERGPVVGKTCQEAEALIPDQRVFVQRIRHNGKLQDAMADTVIHAGDIVAVAGRREVLVSLLGSGADEVDDRELLAVPIEGVDVYVTSKDVDGKTLAQLAHDPAARTISAKDRPRRDRNQYPDYGRYAVAARRYRYPRRTHPRRSGRNQDVGLSGPGDRRGGRRFRLVRRSRSGPCSVQWSTRSAACRLRSPPPAVS